MDHVIVDSLEIVDIFRLTNESTITKGNCIFLLIADSLAIVDILRLTDKSAITRGDSSLKYTCRITEKYC